MDHNFAYLNDDEVNKTKAQILLDKCKKMNEGKIPVRVDERTTIFIKPGEDPVKAVEKYKAVL